MRLVVLSGIDGTGKSTLAHRLVDELRADGIRAEYRYLRTRPVLARISMATGRALWLRGSNPWIDYGHFARQRTARLHNGLLGSGYASTVLLDYFGQTWSRLLPDLVRDRVLIVDRYWPDTVVSDIAVHLGLTLRQTVQIVDAGYRLLPRPLLTLILDAPSEVALSRKSDVPDVRYLDERRRYFLCLGQGPHTEVVDASGSQDLTYLDALQRVRAALCDEGRF